MNIRPVSRSVSLYCTVLCMCDICCGPVSASVTSRCSTKMTKHRITISQESSFLVPKISAKFRRGHLVRTVVSKLLSMHSLDTPKWLIRHLKSQKFCWMNDTEGACKYLIIYCLLHATMLTIETSLTANRLVDEYMGDIDGIRVRLYAFLCFAHLYRYFRKGNRYLSILCLSPFLLLLWTIMVGSFCLQKKIYCDLTVTRIICTFLQY